MTPTIILPYTPERTTYQDIYSITRYLRRRDPLVQFLPFNYKVEPIILGDIVSPRTITVTLNNNASSPIFDFIPGPKFFAPLKSKSQLTFDLIDRGIPMPHTEILSPTKPPSKAHLGPYTVIKTTVPWAFRGKKIHVFRTEHFDDLHDTLLKIYQQDIAAGYAPLLQQYINTGPNPEHTCVLSFLGEPIICFKTCASTTFEVKDLRGLAGSEATSNSTDTRIVTLCKDEDVLEAAKKVCVAFPDISVLGIDLVRCVDTKKVFCIEINLSNFCVLSSPLCRGLRRRLGSEAIHAQFGSYDTIARRMIESLPSI